MANIKKLENGKYQIRIYIGKENGFSKYKKITCNTQRECKAKAKEVLYCNKKEPLKKISVYKAVETYINNKSNILSAGTIRYYKSICRVKFDSIREKNIYDLTLTDVQEIVNIEAGKSSPKTVRNIFGLLFAALKTYGIDFKVCYPQKTKYVANIPNSDIFLNILKLAENTKMELPILISAMLGLRRGEICALEWNDVDFVNNTITINKSLIRDEYGLYVLKTTKTPESTRVLSMPQYLYEKLLEVKGTERIVELSPNSITKRFLKIRSMVTDKNIRFHDLRHYYASVLLSLNVPGKYISHRLGHSSENMIKNV